MAPDAPDAVKFLDSCCCFCCSGIIYRWAVTQDLTTQQQPQAGIRYFDLRVASRSDTDVLYLVHSLNAQDASTFLKNVRDFLVLHPKEAVLLDFRHFYEMTLEQHGQLLETMGALVCMCRMYRSVHRDVPSVLVCIGMGARACDRHIPNVPTQTYRHIRDKMAVVAVSLVTILAVNT